jgi:hypothetical protein
MKRLLGEYYGDNNDRVAKIVVDDVGIISVECWDGKQMITEKSIVNSGDHNSLEDYADDWVRNQ